jgi:hypothetical protein
MAATCSEDRGRALSTLAPPPFMLSSKAASCWVTAKHRLARCDARIGVGRAA